jgi:hypothetical protein
MTAPSWSPRSGRARAYQEQILVWHETVNDRLDGRAIAVTYSACTNTPRQGPAGGALGTFGSAAGRADRQDRAM